MPNTCPIIGCTIPDDRYISNDALDLLLTQLTQLPDLWDDLEDALTRRVRFTDPQHGHTATPRLPYDPIAASMRRKTIKTLDRLIDSLLEAHLTRTRPKLTSNYCEWAAIMIWEATMNNLPAHPIAVETCETVRDLTDQITHVIDRPAEQSFCGNCEIQFDDGTICDTPLYTRPGATHVTCRGCGRTFTTKEIREYFLTKAETALVTATQATQALQTTILNTPVNPATIRKWKQRGHLQPASTAGGHTLYRLGDIINLATAA